MNIWAKMMTALRGGVNEAGEAIVDSQALRILDQEVRDASEGLKLSKDSLAEIIARQKLAEQKVAGLQKKVEEHEAYAVKALDKSDEALALEVAGKIADFENQLKQEQESVQAYAANADKLRAAIKQTEQNLKRLKQQVDTVKATDNVQRAQAAVAERHSGSNSKMRTAMDSLERIKERQELKSAQMAAASELAQEDSDVSLQAKLEAAGIASSGASAADVLERLKNKKA
ncbi:PspA/IM30 family protein [Simiduia curdlanivorans]|uniref:PspA/IM30 family protein n=1 Tax=Simiduia curdlanivorans TaxID=1492769 RepID=A0ABV8V2R4_9GAMM|nr:PspA/IM30 family protein [Simiduia curdlanivorans]MDN3637708.1 PspA/IM30 family protein [Simiduia curdlanivorans]